jgi:hypothetical protein
MRKKKNKENRGEERKRTEKKKKNNGFSTNRQIDWWSNVFLSQHLGVLCYKKLMYGILNEYYMSPMQWR